MATAADLPDTANHRSSEGMARVLVQYMDDARAVRRRILEDFERAPAIVTIKRMRREYLERRSRPDEIEPHKLHEGYYPAEQSRQLEWANKRFVEALERERAFSVEVARANGALQSPYLTDQRLVDRAVEREIDRARALSREGHGG